MTKARKTVYANRRKLAVMRGTWEYPVPVATVMEHINGVKTVTGMTNRQYAAAAGVHEKWFGDIMRGHIVTYVTAATARKILSVTTDTIPPPARRVDSTGTVRRLRALAVAGWAASDVAEATGLSHATMLRIRRDEFPVIYRTTAVRVARAYRVMWLAKPPMGTPRQEFTVQRTQRWAAARGWVPGAAWDDMDDPADVPQGVSRAHTNRRRRVA